MGLFHITARSAWEAAQVAGEYVAPSLATEGFIHLSGDRQWLATAERWFRGQPGLVLLSIREDQLTAPVRWEKARPPRPDGARFPHLYGPLPLAAVVDVFDLPVADDGTIGIPAALLPWRHYFDPR